MKIHRIFIKDIDFKDTLIINNKETLHHLINVLKLKVDENVILFSNMGKKKDFLYNIKDIIKDRKDLSLTLSLVDTVNKEIKTRREINVFIAIIKNNYDVCVRSSAELGVANFTPIITSRTEKKNINIDRFTKIIEEATEQSDRNDIMKLNVILRLEEIKELPKNSLIMHTKKEGEGSDNIKMIDDLKDHIEIIRKNDESVNIFIGPEGGFTEKEVSHLTLLGAKSYVLPCYTLRAETACISCISYFL